MTPAELRYYLERRGIGPYVLARELEVTPQTVYRWLSGESKLTHMHELALIGLDEIRV